MTQNLKIKLGCRGAAAFKKASYPIRYGRYAAIEYHDFLFQFNLNGEVKYISSAGPGWPHPAEWLKRTIGNDWVYYSTGSYYAGVFDLFGEYYLPCPNYTTNTLFKENPFAREGVVAALHEFAQLGKRMPDLIRKTKSREVREFLAQVNKNSPAYLQQRADALHRILKARVSVLPPDCRHVDYEVIPLMITEGCMYNCSFCGIKSGIGLACRTRDEIGVQLLALDEFLGPDRQNYNSIYLGQHDTLCAKPDDILFAAQKAYEILKINKSYLQGPRIFLFGSAESFLHTAEDFWQRLNRLPFFTHVNLGLESFDDNTLEFLKKPVGSALVSEAFTRMLAINKGCENIEVTANFLLGEDLPASHITTLLDHVGKTDKAGVGKGCLYISPLKGSTNGKELLQQFRAIKQKSRFQTFLYLIQRL